MPKISPVSYKRLVKIFEAEGFIYKRTHGDHLIYTKSGLIRPLVIPKHASVPVFVIKNLLRISGIDREKYLKLI